MHFEVAWWCHPLDSSVHFKINVMTQISLSPLHTLHLLLPHEPTILLMFSVLMDGTFVHLAAHTGTWAFSLHKERVCPFLAHTLMCQAAVNPMSSIFQMDSKYNNLPLSPSPLPWSGLCCLGKSSGHMPLVSPRSFSSLAVPFLREQLEWSEAKICFSHPSPSVLRKLFSQSAPYQVYTMAYKTWCTTLCLRLQAYFHTLSLLFTLI